MTSPDFSIKHFESVYVDGMIEYLRICNSVHATLIGLRKLDDERKKVSDEDLDKLSSSIDDLINLQKKGNFIEDAKLTNVILNLIEPYLNK